MGFLGLWQCWMSMALWFSGWTPHKPILRTKKSHTKWGLVNLGVGPYWLNLIVNITKWARLQSAGGCGGCLACWDNKWVVWDPYEAKKGTFQKGLLGYLWLAHTVKKSSVLGQEGFSFRDIIHCERYRSPLVGPWFQWKDWIYHKAGKNSAWCQCVPSNLHRNWVQMCPAII